jgi:hypothetical protein
MMPSVHGASDHIVSKFGLYLITSLAVKNEFWYVRFGS